MHAYVKFTDGWQLILPTTLIKKCSPRNDEDFDATRICQTAVTPKTTTRLTCSFWEASFLSF